MIPTTPVKASEMPYAVSDALIECVVTVTPLEDPVAIVFDMRTQVRHVSENV